MISYLIHKISYATLTLFGVVTVVFFLFTVLPGDPARMMLDQHEQGNQLAIIKKKYGFDKPILIQYIYYLNDLSPVSFHTKTKNSYTFLNPEKYTALSLFDIGTITVALKFPYLRESFQKNGKKVAKIIAETLPNTIVLAVSAIIIATGLGILLGVFSAVFKNTMIDGAIQILSTLGMSIPSFFSVILSAWIFGFLLHNYTGLNMTGSLYEVDDFEGVATLQLKNLILPAIVLGVRPLAVVTQLMRNSLLEVLAQDYIRTASAKGLSRFQVVQKHALKNALNPVITALSGWFGSMLAGAVFVEYIFGWNGIGKEIVNALHTLDLPVIMGSVLVIATLFIIITIFIDVIYGWLDPKIRVP